MESKSIEWHENCLKNSRMSEERILKEALTVMERYVLLKNENNFRQFQIDRAIKEAKTEFNADRWCVKKS